jgi:hypothetical protein
VCVVALENIFYIAIQNQKSMREYFYDQLAR